MNYESLELLLKNIKKLKVLVAGDIGIDNYIVGDAKRISPEAPVPVVRVNETYDRLGLAANVVSNISSLGGLSSIISTIGADKNSSALKDMFLKLKFDTDGLVFDKNKTTIKKIRVLASKQHHVVRIDFEDFYSLEEPVISQLVDKYKILIKDKNLVILQDYAKGFFNKTICDEFISIAKSKNIPVFVDPSRKADPCIYSNADLIKPNLDEFKIMCKLDLEKKYDYDLYAKNLVASLKCKFLVVTKGKDGLTVYENKKNPFSIASNNFEVYDVSGAGDTVIASLALAYVSGSSINDAAFFANLTAGIVVTKIGTSTVNDAEVLNFYKKL